MTESLFEPYDENRNYRSGFWPAGTGHWSYTAQMIELAIRKDSWPMIQEAIASGWITPECRAFDGSTVADYCLFREARAIALELRALGWPEWQRAA